MALEMLGPHSHVTLGIFVSLNVNLGYTSGILLLPRYLDLAKALYPLDVQDSSAETARSTGDRR